MSEDIANTLPPEAFKVTPDDLKEAGLWDMYCEIRDAYFAKGLGAKKAKIKTLEEVYPLLLTYQKPNEEETSSDSSSTANEKSPGRDGQGATCLNDRDAGIVEVIMWVAKNLETPESELSPSDAPSSEAWGMLTSYRSSSERRDMFWDRIYMKLVPSKAQLEATKTTGKMDGSNITNTIDKILSLNDKLRARPRPDLSVMSTDKTKYKAKKRRKRSAKPLSVGVAWGVER